MSKLDLIAQLANRAKEVADQCDIHANAQQPNNPWDAVGRLRSITRDLVAQISLEIAFEQREKFERDQYQAEMRRLRDARLSRAEMEYAVPATGEI